MELLGCRPGRADAVNEAEQLGLADGPQLASVHDELVGRADAKVVVHVEVRVACAHLVRVDPVDQSGNRRPDKRRRPRAEDEAAHKAQAPVNGDDLSDLPTRVGGQAEEGRLVGEENM